MSRVDTVSLVLCLCYVTDVSYWKVSEQLAMCIKIRTPVASKTIKK